jgi:phosphoadenosine phosphosulfate reductase
MCKIYMAVEQDAYQDVASIREQLVQINEALSGMSAEDRIRQMHGLIDPSEITYTTSGGKTSAIIPSLVRDALGSAGPPFTLVFVDTLLYGQSTLDFVETLRRRAETDGYNLLTYVPHMTLLELSHVYPNWGDYSSEDFAMAKYVLKQEPLDRAFRELKTRVWGSGIMRDELASRANTQFLELRKDDVFTFHPIADWTQEVAMKYIHDKKLPINPKHRDFFKGEDQSLECGIHSS